MLDKIQSFYGFTKMPSGRDIAPGQLHRHHGHAEAVARLRPARAPRTPTSWAPMITLRITQGDRVTAPTRR